LQDGHVDADKIIEPSVELGTLDRLLVATDESVKDLDESEELG
jgi:hypothetical protein